MSPPSRVLLYRRGAYKHNIPASVDHLTQRSEFMTSYTPYQPEIAQGTLQAIFEFQTQVAALTAMDVANASMYDLDRDDRGGADGPSHHQRRKAMFLAACIPTTPRLCAQFGA